MVKASGSDQPLCGHTVCGGAQQVVHLYCHLYKGPRGDAWIKAQRHKDLWETHEVRR